MAQSTTESCLNSPDVEVSADNLFKDILKRQGNNSKEKLVFFSLVNMTLLREFVRTCLSACVETNNDFLIAEMIRLLGEFTQQDEYAHFLLGGQNSIPETILGTLIRGIKEQNS